jgi:O-antigen ligase
MKDWAYKALPFVGVSLGFSVLGAIATAYSSLLPLLIVVVSCMVVRILKGEPLLLLFSAFLIPFTFDLPLPGGHNLGLPGEAVMLVLSGAWVLHYASKRTLSTALFHPMIVAMVLFFGCLSWSTLWSNDDMVSRKTMFTQTMFMLAGFAAPCWLILSGKVNLFRWIEFLAIGLTLVSVYALLNWAVSDPVTRSSSQMARPFYKDHTIFSAANCLLMPVLFWLRSHQTTMLRKNIFTVAGFVCTAAVFLAASRAAWISLLFALALGFACRVKLKTPGFLSVAALAIILVMLGLRPLERWALTNRNDSSRFQSSLKEQALSVANITNDVSNLERLNRWKCALRMVRDRPFTGYGPGTYQVAYLPYQRMSEMTRISVVTPFYIKDGKGGTAHSEYFLLLAETGWPGLWAWLLLLIAVLYTAHRLSIMYANGPLRAFRQAVAIGLATFWLHGLFNNFLTSANFAWLYWVMLATLFILHIGKPSFAHEQYQNWRVNI